MVQVKFTPTIQKKLSKCDQRRVEKYSQKAKQRGWGWKWRISWGMEPSLPPSRWSMAFGSRRRRHTRRRRKRRRRRGRSCRHNTIMEKHPPLARYPPYTHFRCRVAFSKFEPGKTSEPASQPSRNLRGRDEGGNHGLQTTRSGRSKRSNQPTGEQSQ